MTNNLLLTSDYQSDTDAEHLNSFGEDENLLNLQRFNFQETILVLNSVQKRLEKRLLKESRQVLAK